MYTVFDEDMLSIIRQHEECTVNELRMAYLPPKQPGFISGQEATFPAELQKLIDSGAVERIGDILRYIKEPREHM